MPSVQHIDVEVRPSQQYQTVGFTARIVFDEPVSLDEAKFEADLAYDELASIALKRIGELAEVRGPETARAPMQSPVAITGHGDWRIASKPEGRGSFRYLPTTVVTESEFVNRAKAKLPDMGFDVDQLVVFDDRGGARGIEAGNEFYCAGKVKARNDSALAAAMQGKSIVANIDFDDSGDLKVTLSRDGKAALQAIQIASQLAGSSSTPF